MDNARNKEVIITDLAGRGAGVEGSPFRRITQVYSKDGKLIAEVDPCSVVVTQESVAQLISKHGAGVSVQLESLYKFLTEAQNV